MGRMIDAEMWEDEFFTSLSVFERLLWIGLIAACADDQGRLKDNAALIRSKVFPLDDIAIQDVDSALHSIEQAGKIARYVVNGKPYIQIVNWWKHQRGQWAGRSHYPPPANWRDRERFHTTGNRIHQHNWDLQGGYIDGYIAGYIEVKHSDEVKDDVKEEVEDDVKVEVEGKFTPSASPDIQASTLFSNVTGMPALPGRRDEINDTLGKLRVIIQRQGPKAREYLTTYWEAWTGRGYKKTNNAWLDWALAGEIPKQGGKSVVPELDRQKYTRDAAKYGLGT